MKIIIAGSRTLYPVVEHIQEIVDESRFEITEVVCGLARGVDSAGKVWAEYNNIPVKEFPANWKKYHGKQAGPIRNKQMAKYADGLIAIWDGSSRGTLNMIMQIREMGKKIFVKEIRI